MKKLEMSSQKSGEAKSKKTGDSSAEADNKGTFREELVLRGNPYPVKEDDGPFANFYLNKLSTNMREKHPEASYELEKNSDGLVTAVVWHNISEAQQKELQDALDWTLRKIEENRKAEI